MGTVSSKKYAPLSTEDVYLEVREKPSRLVFKNELRINSKSIVSDQMRSLTFTPLQASLVNKLRWGPDRCYNKVTLSSPQDIAALQTLLDHPVSKLSSNLEKEYATLSDLVGLYKAIFLTKRDFRFGRFCEHLKSRNVKKWFSIALLVHIVSRFE